MSPAARRRLEAVPEGPRRAIIYIRVSETGDRGDDLTSPELQERAARDYCTRRGYAVVAVLTDIDRSGRYWSRRQVEQAVQTVERGDADVIVCWRWSRFTRNLRDYVIQTARIEQAGGRLEAALEETDPATAAGLLQRDLFAILAQWESRKIGEQWRETFDRRHREGLGHSSIPRLGYRIVGKQHEPDPESRHLAVEVYRRYLAGDGGPQLATWLNQLGVRQPRSGHAWSPKTVRRYLDSGWAAGLLRVGDAYIEGAHEPVIDVATWRAFLRERDRRRDVPARLVAPVHALSGLVRCPGCRRAMRVKRLRPRRNPAQTPRNVMLSCETFGCERRGYVSARRAVDAVIAWLRPLVDDHDVSAAAQAADRASRAVAKVDRTQLEKEVVKIEQRMARLTVDLASGLVLPADYQAARDLLAQAKRDALAALAGAQQVADRPAPTRRRIKAVLDAWGEMDEVGRNRALRELVAWVDLVPQEHGRALIRPLGVWEVADQAT